MRILAVEPEPFQLLPYSFVSISGSPEAHLPLYRAVVDGLPDGLDAMIATADLQGVASCDGVTIHLGEALARAIESLQASAQLPGRDKTAIVLAGDLHGRAGEEDVIPIWTAMERIGRWVVGVAGNHDRLGKAASRVDALDVLHALNRLNLHFLDQRIVTVDGMWVGGISGIVSERGGNWVRSEDDFVAAVAAMVGQGCDIVVMHDGPNVAGTDLPGWPSVRRALEAAPRTVVVRGHDHWPTPLATLANGTQVLNVEGRAIVLRR